jgi:archaellum component FlaC
MADDAVLTALARLEAGQAGIGDRLGRIEHRFERFDDSLERIETGLKTFRVDAMSRMDRLENRLTEIRDDVGVAMGSAESIRRVHDDTREDPRGMHETLTVLYRKVNRLETEVRGIKGDP